MNTFTDILKTMDSLLLTIITILVGIVGYFIKRILDKTETIGVDVADIKPKVDILWKDKYAPATSPRQLNERGQKILNESGIKEVIENKKNTLLEIIKSKGAKNAYDAEQVVLSVVEKLPEHCPDVIDQLKTGAFKTGANVDTVLLVGGLYLRDLIFPELGFSVEDLDKPKA